MAEPLAGRRVLLVEDEALVAMLIEDALDSAGAVMLGPYAAVAPALAAIPEALPELAVLDLNLAGESSLPIADDLAGRGVPLVFASGYGQAGLPPRFRGRPMLAKPFDPAELISVLAALWEAAQPREKT
jgi:DNA-binding response OmpR family regulator